jgi:two-component system, response regulator YesN
MKPINKIFLNFIRAYIILILIPLISGIIINTKIVREYEHYVKVSHLTYLKKTQEVLESFTEDIKWSTYQIANNTRLLRLINAKNENIRESEKSLLIKETIADLKKSLLFNTSFNSTFYIYLKDEDTVITPYSFYNHNDFNNSFNFFRMENIKSSDWHMYITSKYHGGTFFNVRSTIIEDFKNKNMIPYVQTIPIGSNINVKNIKGTIVYLIGESDFTKFLDSKSIPKGGFSYIADGNNNILTYLSNTLEKIEPLDLQGNEGMIEAYVHGKKMFIIFTSGSKNNWKYVSVLPEEWVLSSVRFYQLISILVMSVALLVCLLAAYNISVKWSKPINKGIQSITDYLKMSPSNFDSINSIDKHINRLIDQNQEIQGELRNQEVFVHNVFVNRIINGFFKNEEGLNRYLTHMGFFVSQNSFNIVLFSLKDFDLLGTPESFEDYSNIKDYLVSTIQENINVKMILSEEEDSNIVVIFMTDNMETHSIVIENAINSYIEKLPSLYKINLTVSIGDPVKSLMEIHKSYIQAVDILSSSDLESKGIILTTSSISTELDNYYYPIEIESKLIASVRSGNVENTNRLLDIIYEENYSKRTLNIEFINSFYQNLTNTYNRIFNQLPQGIQDIIKPEFELITEYNFCNIKKILVKIAILQNSNKKSHNNILIEEVKRFLKDNYGDNNLSLYSVSEKFSITESYLSFYFKEQTGINFSNYLENLRMQRAKDLLLNTDKTIQVISQEIGYNSDKTFRRVFQKIESISPSNYRIENKN